jgi:hypothetical protein
MEAWGKWNFVNPMAAAQKTRQQRRIGILAHMMRLSRDWFDSTLKKWYMGENAYY